MVGAAAIVMRAATRAAVISWVVTTLVIVCSGEGALSNVLLVRVAVLLIGAGPFANAGRATTVIDTRSVPTIAPSSRTGRKPYDCMDYPDVGAGSYRLRRV